MLKISEMFGKNGLYARLLCVIVAGVTLVTVVTAAISIYAADKAYLESYCRSDATLLEQQQDVFDGLYLDLLQFSQTIDRSWAFQRYLTDLDLTTREASATIYTLNKHVESAATEQFRASISYLAVGMNDRYIISNNATLKAEVSELRFQPLAKLAEQNPRQLVFGYLDSGYTSFDGGGEIFASAKLLTYAKTDVPYGYLFVFIRDSVLTDPFAAQNAASGTVWLVNDDGVVISPQGGMADDAVLDGIRAARDSGELCFYYTLDGVETAVVSRYVSSMGFYIVDFINRGAVRDPVMTLTIVMAAIAIGLLVCFAALIIIRKTTRPLYALIDSMTNQFRKPVELRGSSEVQDLQAAYNNMLSLITLHIEQLKTAEHDKRAAELHALQMQINPHFIYNTLTAIKWLVFMGDKEKSVAAIDCFIGLLQNTISNRSEMITVAEEAENIRNYMFLQHIRFGDLITTEILAAEDCEGCLVPKLVVQPFVENAFFHAFTVKKEGFIFVSFKRRGERLLIEITDNGDGMTPQQVENIFKPKPPEKNRLAGIGVCNVSDRIKLIYGGEYGVECRSAQGGTTFVITLPAES